MVESWSDFCSVFSIGLVCGFTTGLVALSVRWLRTSFTTAFRKSMTSW